MRTILLTNDDGVMSPGLWALHEALITPLSLNMSTTGRREETSKLGKKLHKAGFTEPLLNNEHGAWSFMDNAVANAA